MFKAQTFATSGKAHVDPLLMIDVACTLPGLFARQQVTIGEHPPIPGFGSYAKKRLWSGLWSYQTNTQLGTCGFAGWARCQCQMKGGGHFRKAALGRSPSLALKGQANTSRDSSFLTQQLQRAKKRNGNS